MDPSAIGRTHCQEAECKQQCNDFRGVQWMVVVGAGAIFMINKQYSVQDHRSMSHNNNNNGGRTTTGRSVWQSTNDDVQVSKSGGGKYKTKCVRIQENNTRNIIRYKIVHQSYTSLTTNTIISREYLRIILSYYRMTDSINNIVIHMGIIQPHRNEIQYCM